MLFAPMQVAGRFYDYIYYIYCIPNENFNHLSILMKGFLSHFLSKKSACPYIERHADRYVVLLGLTPLVYHSYSTGT